MKFNNEATIRFKSKSVNEYFARNAIAAFIMQLNPTIEQMNDVKTAVSEAVTNCKVHAYDSEDDYIEIFCGIEGEKLHIKVSDSGKGIADIEKAMQPFYTTCPEDERSGMGFTVMETFMDSLHVENNTPKGTVVYMTKIFGNSGK
ncbi:MAG: anti-sigma F factor [Clostridia bacterium]|nr:anti-sigma F factor [Clostridia bacterium]